MRHALPLPLFHHKHRNKGGGYALSRPPELISIGELIRALDGPIALLPCVSHTAYQRCEECVDELTCGIRSVMKEVRDRTAEVLDGTTLADLAIRSRAAEEAKPAMYYI